MKKVLIISYYWPPAGGISPLRCLKIAKYLREFGWEPVVYSPTNASYPIIDNSYFKDIPPNMEELKGNIVEPFTLFKLLSGKKKDTQLNNIFHVRDNNENFVDKLGKWIRSNFFIPDARALWVKPSVKRLYNFIKNNQVDAIFTDGPPHTNTLIGHKLKLKTGLPWLSDYQDPWTQVDYYEKLSLTKWADKKHRKLEKECLTNADALTIASDSWSADLGELANKKVDVLYYGYDEDDFKDLQYNLSRKFSIFHGGLLGYDRSPDLLFDVLVELVEEKKILLSEIELNFAGQVDFTIKEKLSTSILHDVVNYLGTLQRTDVLKHLINSQINLLPINKAKNSAGRIPGKLFELLRAKRPILCLINQPCDSGMIVEKTFSGKAINYLDKASMKEFLAERYKLYKLGKNFLSNQKNIDQFSNFEQTKKVAKILDKITSN